MLSSNRLLIYLKSNGTASYSTLKCVFCVRMSVFVLVCVIPPTANLTNSVLTGRLASWWKTAYCSQGSQQTNWVRDSQILPSL